MKVFTIILISCFSFSILADDHFESDNRNITQDTVQSNDAINSPTSVMNNTQVNSGVTFDSYGNGVACARTTMQMGAIGSVNSSSIYNTGTQVYVGFSMPIGSGSDCKKAAQSQISLAHQREMNLRDSNNRTNIDHKKEMKKKDLLYADLLAKVCRNYHETLVSKNDFTMAVECENYKVIDHHKPHYDKSEYSRIADH